jgi:MFS family permease
MKPKSSAAWIAWFLAALFYFYQYALRSAPAVMMPQLSAALGLSTVGVASLIGLFYYGYSPFALVSGAAIDRVGAKAVVPAGALMTALGALLFATGSVAAANIGRLLQGAGGVFSFVGAVYIIGKYFPNSRAATLIGATQMIGMAGGSAGQFLVGPLVMRGIVWNRLWLGMGLLGLLLAAALFVMLPKREAEAHRGSWIKSSGTALALVARNPQSILCGLIAGLLFIPTNILDMIWGVRFLQEGHGFSYAEAVIRSATVPVGWIIGCPLLGWISDRFGRRKPVIIAGACVLFACTAWILYGSPDALPPYVLGLAAGVASGSAMIPYTVIKEAHPPELNGTATGLMNFLCFTFSALVGPVFGWIMQNVSAGSSVGLEEYQLTFKPLLWGVGLAIVLTFGLKETGTAARVPVRRVRAVESI